VQLRNRISRIFREKRTALLGVLSALLFVVFVSTHVESQQARVLWEQLGGATDGTVTVPSIAFQADLDTGFYSVGANHIGLATGGVSRERIDSIGGVHIGDNTGVPTSGHTGASSDALIIPVDWWYDSGHRRVHTRSVTFVDVDDASESSIKRSEGTAPNGPAAAVSVGMVMGELTWSGYIDGVSGFLAPSAVMHVIAREVPTSTSRGGDLRFLTNPTVGGGFTPLSGLRSWFAIQSTGEISMWEQTVDVADSDELQVFNIDDDDTLNIGLGTGIVTTNFWRDIRKLISITDLTVQMAFDASEGNLYIGRDILATNPGGTNNLVFDNTAIPITMKDTTSAIFSRDGLSNVATIHIIDEGGLVYRIGSGSLLTIGGLDGNFPALKRSGAIVQIREANDGDWAPFEARTWRANGVDGIDASVACGGTVSLTIGGGIVTAQSCT
jgi:hypothetical protein